MEPNAGVSYLRLHYHNATDTTTYDFILNANAARESDTSGTAGPLSSKPSMTACPRRMPNALPSWVPVDLTCAST